MWEHWGSPPVQHSFLSTHPEQEIFQICKKEREGCCSPTRIDCPVGEAGVAGAGEGGVGGPTHLVHTGRVGSTVGGGGRRVGEALVDIPALPVCSLPHTPVGGQTVLVSLAPVLVVAASGSIL